MDIEYFAETKVVLIHGHEPKMVAHLLEQVASLATRRVNVFAVHELPGFRSINGCQLFVRRADADFGMRQDRGSLAFECELRPITWDNVVGLLEPFSDGSYFAASHQFLSEHSEISLIISGGRGW